MQTSRWKRVVLAVVTALLAFAGLASWAVASPVGAAPDDDFHLASIWCALGERDGLCAPGAAEDQRVVSERLVGSSECFAHKPHESAQCPISDTKTVNTDRGNFMANYPPVFYGVMAVFASPDIAVSTIAMRLFNAALFVGAVSAVLALLRPGQRGPLLWAAVVTLVPLGVFIIPSVNPSSWAVLAGLTVWLAFYGYYTAETRGRRIALGAIAAVLGVMGAGARGDSAVYVAFAAFAAAILAFEKSRRWLLLSILPFALMVVGGVFFLAAGQSTGVATVGASQVGADGSSAGALADVAGAAGAAAEASAAGSSALNDLIVNVLSLPYLWTGGTGTWGLGWIDTPVPPTTWIAMIGVLLAVILWGMRLMERRKGLMMAAAMLALAVLPLYILWGMGIRVGEWVQPRYLLPLLIVFVGLSLFGFAKDHLGLSRLQAMTVFAAVAIANSLALQANMRRYITGVGQGFGFNLNIGMEWWWATPVQPMTVWAIGTVSFALMLVGLLLWLYPKGERPGAPLEDRAPAFSLSR